MEKTTILDNQTVEVSFFIELGLALLVWKHSNISSAEYRNTYLELLKYSDEVKGTLFLVDSRLQGVITPQDRKWFMDYVIEKAIKNGLKRAAVIMKKNPFKKYYINSIMKFVLRKTNLELKVFFDYDEGLAWLKSYNK